MIANLYFRLLAEQSGIGKLRCTALPQLFICEYCLTNMEVTAANVKQYPRFFNFFQYFSK